MASTRQQRRSLERARRKAAGRGTALSSGAALTLGVAMAAAPGQAATFTVMNLNDSGANSLRQAVLDANLAAGPDIIDFQVGLTGAITLTTGELPITDSIDIQGPGTAVITVDGNNSSRIFNVDGAGILDVSISGLTLTAGHAADGGGIFNANEDLEIADCVISGNTATNDGGGIYTNGETAIRNTLISGNHADSGGGGLYTDGPFTVRITDCTIASNTAYDNGGGLYTGGTTVIIDSTRITGNAALYGGGVYASDASQVTITGSTVSGNTALYDGGGLYLNGGTVTIADTTISGNSAVFTGGGIAANELQLTMTNCTVSGNIADDRGGGLFLLYAYGSALRHTTVAGNSAASDGGGIYLYGYNLPVEHTIIADNTSNGSPGDIAGSGTFNARFSLIEAPGSATLNDLGGNVLNLDPQLGGLTNNGGPTETHLPAPGSPAVNAGDPAFTPPPNNDQRGAGFPRVVGGRIDIGSVERDVVVAGTLQFSLSGYSVNEHGITATITVIRVGGSQGAVSVSYQASDGSATQPADYLPAAGMLSWADGDAAPKTFQITIVNDLFVEGDETVNLTLSNPQGGAVVGSPDTAVLTIVDDDSILETIPTLGDAGKLLFAGLCGLAGLLLLRRRKLAAPVLALTLAAAAAGPAQAAPPHAGRPTKENRAAVLVRVETAGDRVILRLADGTAIEARREQVDVKDERQGHANPPPGISSLPAGQPVVLQVKHGPNGAVKKIKVVLYDSAAQAAANAASPSGDRSHR